MAQDTKVRFVRGSNTPRNEEELVTIYKNNIQQFGYQAKTLLYPDDELHTKKIDQYYQLLQELLIPGESLLDVGCGYGSLIKKLLEKLKEDIEKKEYKYRGIDIVQDFISYAQNEYEKDTSDQILFRNIPLKEYTEKEDWCLLLGVVNSVPEPEEMVSLAWEKCKKGLIVDFNDIEKVPQTKYNKFIIEAQERNLSLQGAVVERRYEETYGWTILVARKKSAIAT